MTTDVIDVIKNLQTLSENNTAFKVLKDFERVIDELDVYVFRHWEDGELILGPKVDRYTVTCTFMWTEDKMPSPQGKKRLEEYGCEVKYKKDKILIPRKIKDPEDFRPGTKKGKIDAHTIWTVEITMPKKLMQDISVGHENKEQNELAEFMKYNQNVLTPDAAAQETPDAEEAPEIPEA